ncbi:flagellar hook-length control protein FliK [Clostridium homopropionicum DSM 5847]|uniref:Flagellar hook-length control protein FliK n=1 Tax=Clostridium homopropionicum DSM 5847 TaxID=1121318 RepID=A0A0L6ZDF9_9CLOT|nr:flagellar hook-length control protein FliK [Clostridium homopropionicum]KOA21011.1 flagellar hook-length control protein FliK [Clostridium homopropionicum DSM 5847]SFF99541.1 flagellar hook-length control protein FliK [Clostridium homopropionicum]
MNNYSMDMSLYLKNNLVKNTGSKVDDKNYGENNISIEKKYPNDNSKKDDFKKLLEKNYESQNSYSNGIKKDDTTNSKDDITNNQISLKEGDNTSNNIEDNNSIISEENVKAETNANNEEELILLLLQNLLNGKLDLKELNVESIKNSNILEGLSKELSVKLIDMLKQQFSIPENKANSLYESFNKEIMSILNNSLSEENLNNLSVKDILSVLSEKISKEVYSSNIGMGLMNVRNEQSLKEKVQEILEAKLSNSNSIQEVKTQIAANTTSSSQSEGNDLNSSSGKEDKFLKELANLDKGEVDTKMDKVASFINGLNRTITTTNTAEVAKNITLSRETFVEDVIKSIKFMDQNNIKEMTVKIVPRELGEVIIKLTLENGAMKANITANNKEAYNLLNSNLQEISSKISNTEIKIQNFSMDLYNGDTTFFSNENSKEDRRQYENNSTKLKSKGSSISDEIETVDSTNRSENSSLHAFV